VRSRCGGSTSVQLFDKVVFASDAHSTCEALVCSVAFSLRAAAL
jgi:hypothetical protein